MRRLLTTKDYSSFNLLRDNVEPNAAAEPDRHLPS